MPGQQGNLWGAIESQAWHDTPCISGRVATEHDVREGRAVFYVSGPSHAANLPLPHCALLHDDDHHITPVILIQAEDRDDGEVLVGYRPLVGGNGICLLSELELLEGPNELFNDDRL